MEYCFTQGVSGWRAVFGADEDSAKKALPQIALASSSFVEALGIESPVILVGMDTRPTSRIMLAGVVQSLLAAGAIVRFAGVTAAPEIMASSSTLDGFVFVTASHNPIEHNGLKFGRGGAVLSAQENAKLSAIYRAKCDKDDAMSTAQKVLAGYRASDLDTVYRGREAVKRKALAAYKESVEKIIGDVSYGEEGFMVVCDFNGGARAMSIDKDFFAEKGVAFHAINDGENGILRPVHGIIPEGDNLVPLAKEMERLRKAGQAPVIGYMTDCDGDRGNIVYWDEDAGGGGKACILEAQQVFALAALHYLHHADTDRKGIAVNCATSGRVDAVAAGCGAHVFRSEVGEANVEAAASAARNAGYVIPIAGEGSNGGLITYPAKVRDPIMTVFAILALLREYGSLKSALNAIPPYTTTGATEARALMQVKVNKARLKEVFLREWESKQGQGIRKEYNFASYDTAFANGAQEIITDGGGDWDNGSGSVKVRFKDKEGNVAAFLWLRASGTEDVLRVMCDVKGGDDKCKKEEAQMLEWWRAMIEEASK